MSLLAILFSIHAAFAAISPEAERVELMAEFDAHMQGMHDHMPGERGICLTGLIQRLELGWHSLTEAERVEVTQKLAPFKTDLFEPLERLPSPPSVATDTCWGSQKDNRIDTEHFSVQWDDGIITESQAQNFADSLEESWEVEINELGWKKPSKSNQYLMLVIVDNLGSGAGAYTTVDSCGSGYAPYVVAGKGSFSAGDWYKTMACHELHHAIQFAYGFAHEFWWWEASATWVEDLVYPGLNDWANALYMFAQTPQLGMNASAGQSNNQQLFWHTYGMGIWGMYLDQHVGGNELVRETWEASEGEWCQYCLWMPDAIEEVGEDFEEVMTGFMAHTSVMDYRDRMWMTDATRSRTINSLPNDGESSSSSRPQSLGMNIIEFNKSQGQSGKDLLVTFDGDNDADEWYAVLSIGNNSLQDHVVFELDADHSGTARIPFDGSAPAHLIVAPSDESAQGYSYDWRDASEFDYSWSAELVETDGSGGSSGTGGTGGSDEGSGSDEGGDSDLDAYEAPSTLPGLNSDDDKGGCSTTGRTEVPVGPLALVALLGLAARRRR